MTRYIQISDSVIDKDAYGFETVIKDNIAATVRAYAEQQRGTHQWANMAAFSTATMLFKFRYIPGLTVTPSMMIIFEGQRYRLTSVEDVRGKHRFIEAYAEVWEPKAGG